jgi:tetratricopeptide (TPR) repeat protein
MASKAWEMTSPDGTIYLTGRVMLDDGTTPVEPVTIECVCHGAPRVQGYTDQKGRFNFQIGQKAQGLPDATADSSGTPGATQLTNCDLRAVVAGFRSDNVSLAGRRLHDDPNVGTILLHRMATVEGAAISLTSLQAPKEARRAFEKALQDSRRNKSAEAAKEFRTAVDIYPQYAAAWYELGRIEEQGSDIAQARQSFASAIAADARFISPYLSMAELEAKAEHWAELANFTGALLRLDAVDYPAAYFYDATAHLNLGQIDTAEKSARAGEKLDTAHQYPQLERVLAMTLEHKKDYAGAAAHLRSYLRLAPDAEDAAQIKKELAELERPSDATGPARAARE